MATDSLFGDTPFVFFLSSAHAIPASLGGRGIINKRTQLQKSASEVARPPMTRRSLVAAFVAVSAVIFLTYVCTFSSGKRLTASPSLRRLAARQDGGACEESEDSSSVDSHADTSTEGDQAVLTPLTPVVQDLHTQRGNAGPTSQTETTTLPFGGKTFEGATSQPETQRTQTSHKRKGEEQSKVGTGAKQLRLEQPSEETLAQSSLPPLDPELESLIDSVLSRGGYAFSEAFWLADADPLHSTADPSTDSKLPPSGGDSELPREDIGSLGTADALSTQPSMLPSTRKGSKGEEGAELPILTDSPDTQTQQGSPVAAEAVHTGTVAHAARVSLRYYSIKILSTACCDANQQGREESSQAFTAEAFDALNEGLATNSGDTGVDTLPLSSRASPAAALQPSAVMVSLESDSTEQSASATQLPTDANVISYFGWLGYLYPGVPDSVLKTHPFYRHPERQPPLSSRSFSVPLAMTFASTQRHPNTVLAQCRELLKKSQLSAQDFEQLLTQAERLCGYAIKRMPVPHKSGKTTHVIDTLGTAILVIDTLHCAAEVLGKYSMKHLWWPLVMRHIEAAKSVPRREFLLPGRRQRNSNVEYVMHVALEYYRRGARPPIRVVIGLKEALLCEPGASSKFRDEQWRPWREDAAHWRQSILPSLPGSK
ncbi:hypothetical protein EBH_0049770 [Eimeria brunetti]|uniref:Transmembrane protein n=1 Tax=Eimeria brunetti TaxID=51314 RepID=U6LQP4_9EIME|nr:hypothetical protein EBH_0049770 [Eimeria brunetti]